MGPKLFDPFHATSLNLLTAKKNLPELLGLEIRSAVLYYGVYGLCLGVFCEYKQHTPPKSDHPKLSWDQNLWRKGPEYISLKRSSDNSEMYLWVNSMAPGYIYKTDYSEGEKSFALLLVFHLSLFKYFFKRFTYLFERAQVRGEGEGERTTSQLACWLYHPGTPKNYFFLI